jgi:hypothetical protein
MISDLCKIINTEHVNAGEDFFLENRYCLALLSRVFFIYEEEKPCIYLVTLYRTPSMYYFRSVPLINHGIYG